MPQLKISDVKEQVEKLEKDINQKFGGLVIELKAILEKANISVDPTSASTKVDTSSLEQKIEELRQDLIGHVQVYNQHIIQQHSKKK